MSFKLVRRNKDGNPEYIRVSVFDAFRSAPPKIAKTAEAPAASNVATTKGTKPTFTTSTATGSDEKRTSSNKPLETWTAEEDAKLLTLKAENTSWKDISTALGKGSITQLKERFKEIGPNARANTKKGEDQKEKADKKKAEGLAKQAALKGGREKKEDSGRSGESGKRRKGKANAGGGGGGADNPNANKDRARDSMRTFVAKYEREKWLAAASRHYDVTGQRISAERAKALFDGK